MSPLQHGRWSGKEEEEEGVHEEKKLLSFCPKIIHSPKLPVTSNNSLPSVLTRWSARQPSPPSASPAPSSSRHWRPSPPSARRWGLGARTARTWARPMGGQHVTWARPIRDEKARAPVAWSVSHFWASLLRRREASLSLFSAHHLSTHHYYQNPYYINSDTFLM